MIDAILRFFGFTPRLRYVSPYGGKGALLFREKKAPYIPMYHRARIDFSSGQLCRCVMCGDLVGPGRRTCSTECKRWAEKMGYL